MMPARLAGEEGATIRVRQPAEQHLAELPTQEVAGAGMTTQPGRPVVWVV
ncbi:MAG: hypothetical protein J7M25_15685 [Deltaproteobacteria bacterium]|nr:hypothetical protein [Deltaproteobacteria bacterium]